MTTPPADEAQLMARARALIGQPLSAIAARHHVPLAADLKRHKGWVGMLIERALGASAGSKAEPDFPALRIELKTVPITNEGRPRETTYVSVCPLEASTLPRWEESWVREKLARVLWVPVLGTGEASERRVGLPVLWSPSEAEDAELREDYDVLAGIIARGAWWDLTAHHGKALQVRPKAANASERVWALDEQAEWVQVNPRGFYLRTGFTQRVLGG